MDDTPLPAELHAAIQQFGAWSTEHLERAQEDEKIIAPLYQYIDSGGLRGIIESQKIWFTSYLHLNDPSEFIYGVDIICGVLKTVGRGRGRLIKMFCDLTASLFNDPKFQDAFGFYIASFSRERNDLGQWRGYADNGRGFALGLAPHLFAVEDKPDRKPHEYVVVMPVVYGKAAGRRHCRAAIDKAAAIVESAARNYPSLMSDRTIGPPFLLEMARTLMASELIGAGLTIKHPAYSHEKEVRLVILGLRDPLIPHVETRVRGSEIVPFIRSDMPIQHNGSIVEVVVGPAADRTAKDGLRNLLRSFHVDPDSLISESGIPYRALK